MMFFHIKVFSKDNHALKRFFQFLQRLKISLIVLKFFSKQKKRKFVSILKSPHVNKTAQEQFEFKYYNKEFLIDLFKPLTFFLLLKKIKILSFCNLKLEIKGLFSLNKNHKNFLKKLINPDNVILEPIDLKTFKDRFFQKKYIQLFDCYGEFHLKKLFF